MASSRGRPKSRIAKSSKIATRPLAADRTQRGATLTPPRLSLRRKMWIAAKATIGALVAAIGLVGSLYGLLGGPPWPTRLDIDVGAPDQSQAFDVPFSVVNQSGLFDAVNAQFVCILENVVLENGAQIERVPTALAGPQL